MEDRYVFDELSRPWKKIEYAIINWFIRTCYRDVPLYATYIETDRNSQLASKYEDLGFSLISQCGVESNISFLVGRAIG